MPYAISWPLAVLLLDIDHFKAFNDHYGHPMGDACLRQVADVLRLGCRRSADTVARFGGEEFIAIFPETDAIDAAGVAEQMRASVADRAIPHGMAGELPMVTISIGVAALVPSNRLRAADLVRMADEALYAASKRAGRNQVVLGAANMIEQIAPQPTGRLRRTAQVGDLEAQFVRLAPPVDFQGHFIPDEQGPGNEVNIQRMGHRLPVHLDYHIAEAKTRLLRRGGSLHLRDQHPALRLKPKLAHGIGLQVRQRLAMKAHPRDHGACRR